MPAGCAAIAACTSGTMPASPVSWAGAWNTTFTSKSSPAWFAPFCCVIQNGSVRLGAIT